MNGFDRDDLPHYLNLCCFMFNPPHEKLKKIEKLLENDHIKGFKKHHQHHCANDAFKKIKLLQLSAITLRNKEVYAVKCINILKIHL